MTKNTIQFCGISSLRKKENQSKIYERYIKSISEKYMNHKEEEGTSHESMCCTYGAGEGGNA